MGLSAYILVAVVLGSVGSSHRPVSLTIEFTSKARCEAAADDIRQRAKSVDFITCLPK